MTSLTHAAATAAIGVLACILGACGGGSSAPPGVDAGQADATNRQDAEAHVDGGDMAKHDAGAPRKDAPLPDSSKAADDASEDASDAGEDVSEAPFDASPYVPIDGGHALLTGTPAETWVWVPFPESTCRDGSTTGLGVNFNPASTKLVIYLEGGGACFNALTCSLNPSSFGAADFPQRFPAESDGGPPEPGNGILDRTNAANPVRDWNFIYVPYCTGDIHAGNNPNGMVTGVGPQVFMGYRNIDLFLQRIVPTFAHASQVLLMGVSGGGFGAAANYAHVKRAFGSVPVDMIDDSGPFMETPYLATCLQDEVRTLWGLDSTVGADCDGACNDPQTFFIDLAKHVLTENPEQTFGLVESLDDATITNFFGFGDDDCTEEDMESAATFEAGLNDIRTQLGSNKNLGTFYFEGTDHTSLGDYTFYERDTSSDGGAVLLTDWVGSMVTGHASNAGP